MLRFGLGGAVLASKVGLSCLLALSAAGYFGRAGKYLELASHFRLQYLLASAAFVLAFAALRAWPWAALALACAAANLFAVAPWYLRRGAAAGGAQGGRELKLILSNVNYANRSYAAVVDYVRRERPDVFVAQEVTQAWAAELEALGDEYPHSRTAPQGRGSGIAVYSRLPFEHSEVVNLVGENRPGIFARLRLGDRTVSLLTVHTHAPLRFGHFESRNELLAAAADFARRMPAPKIFVGDLNTTQWSPYHSDFERASGLVNARRGAGVLPSWPTFMPLGRLLMIPIDHCMVSPEVARLSIATGPELGSDHLPLVVNLSVPAADKRASAQAPGGGASLP